MSPGSSSHSRSRSHPQLHGGLAVSSYPTSSNSIRHSSPHPQTQPHPRPRPHSHSPLPAQPQHPQPLYQSHPRFFPRYHHLPSLPPPHLQQHEFQYSAASTNPPSSYYLPLDYTTANTTSSFDSLAIDVSMQSAPNSASWDFAGTSKGRTTPTSVRQPRGSSHHHRDSSLSSIGSAGPSSPYTTSSSNPQILLPSDSHDAYYDSLSQLEFYTNLQKPLTPHTPSNDFSYGYNEYQSNPSLQEFLAMHKQQSEQESMPAPSSHDSPSHPTFQRLDSSAGDYKDVPKLDRTMSDVYNDELYSPNFAYTSAPSKSGLLTTAPPQNDVFHQRLQAANSQHLSAPPPTSQGISRGRSPFRQGSPLAPTSDTFGSQMRMASAQQIREKQKAEHDAQVLAQQIKRSSPLSNQSAEQTISPKDALLEYKEEEDSSSAPLFPPLVSSGYRPINRTPAIKAEPSSTSDLDDSSSQQSFRSMATTRRESSSAYSTGSQTTPQQSGFAFAPPSVPGGVQVPQQYPFVPQIPREQSNVSSVATDFPSTLTSMESSSSEYAPETLDIKKPAGTTADGGTYTCTYHGCTLRFETPAKLQKHKREGHRASHPVQNRASGSPESVDGDEDGGSGMTSAIANRNSQAGPHKCERINPSTGKPCNTIFSRPYDLTRHEDTIHNARKQKVRCQYCTEEKTFSRNDALTRHMRVVHPEVDFPAGRPRRRGHD